MNLEWVIRAGHPETKDPGYRFKFKYDREVVQDLKQSVPHWRRSWDEEDKTWWVSEEYANVLSNMFGNFQAIIFQQGELF